MFSWGLLVFMNHSSPQRGAYQCRWFLCSLWEFACAGLSLIM
ncbi:hypothetical protein CXB51_031113 [Gossypium anomalum]|uniref:Uncharacterized protein n=1 Tax=Gossypium anomalum TaxID=47600 RepID=A0A8J5YWC7_9ROSI|nr:hypothetical protein CXB51_031113 [Gossypium anomalum]